MLRELDTLPPRMIHFPTKEPNMKEYIGNNLIRETQDGRTLYYVDTPLRPVTQYIFEISIIQETKASLSIYAETTQEAFDLFNNAKDQDEKILQVPGIIHNQAEPVRIVIEHMGHINRGPAPRIQE